MAWYRNSYKCQRCGEPWVDEWSCACDDECPRCGDRDYSPVDSVDLSGFISEELSEFVVYISPASAENAPDYEEVGRYASRSIAEKIMARRIEEEWEKAFS